jgi:WD40 repeat protein
MFFLHLAVDLRAIGTVENQPEPFMRGVLASIAVRYCYNARKREVYRGMKEATIFEAHASYVLNLLFTGDGQTLVSSGMDNVVKLWSALDWNPLRTLEGHANSVNAISLSPDEKTLATGSTDSTVKLWSFADGQVLHTLQDRKKTVAGVQISPDGSWVGAASYGGRVAVWTLAGE